MTIKDLIASFKCHRDEFATNADSYDQGSADAWELAIEEAEKLEKSTLSPVEGKAGWCKYAGINGVPEDKLHPADDCQSPDGECPEGTGNNCRMLPPPIRPTAPATVEGKSYPDTHLYTWEEVQEIMKKSTPAPVERDGLRIPCMDCCGGVDCIHPWIVLSRGYLKQCLSHDLIGVGPKDSSTSFIPLDTDDKLALLGRHGELIFRPTKEPFGVITPVTDILSRHPSPSVSTEELIAELEKRRKSCDKCDQNIKHLNKIGRCDLCIWREENIRKDNFKPIDGKEAK